MPRSRRKSKQKQRLKQKQQIDAFFDDGLYEAYSCKSKNRYSTYWQAKFAADEQMQRNAGLKLKIYEC